MTEIITRTELDALVKSGEVVVDVASPPASYYDQPRIPSAVNLVESEVFGRAALVPANKSAPIVTYCSAEPSGNNRAAPTRLERLGDTEVRKYRAGTRAWVAAGNPTESTRVA
jgi:rhodanese-related sulfurtransferase